MAEHAHIVGEGASGGFFARLLETYTPRRQCMNFDTDVIWTHFVSDLIIAIAYFSIPVALVHFARRRKDLAYNWMFLLFALFIVLCGTTHLFNMIALWSPVYRLDGYIKALTALASIGTAIVLWRLMPQALALPTADELAARSVELERLVAEQTAELTQANNAMRQSEERFRTLAESVPQLVWLADPDGKVLWYNKRWYDYTGTTLAIMEREGWTSVHHPELLPQILERWTACMHNGDPFEMELPLRGADGRYRPFLTRAMASRDADGRIVCWCGTNTDIADRVEMEESLRDADQRKNEFLAMLADELRNPLASISNAAQLVDRVDSDAHRGWAIDVIRRNISKLARLIDDLLDVSRITRGIVELKKERFDAATIIESALQSVRPLNEEKGQTVTAQYTRGALFCHADPLRLEQVVVNLLSNATKYTQRGGHIDVRAELQNGDLVISVRDDGIGIPATLIDRIFDLFTQGERSLARTEGGLGIGLTVVKKIVEMHGGTVTATSKGPGTGSEFIVRLPASVGAPAEPGSGAKLERASIRGPAHILVIDDNADTADGLARFLMLLGHDTRTVYDGRAAIQAAAEFAPDIILVDIGLPGMDGYDVARALRAHHCGKDALIIAVTGYGRSDDLQRSREAGFDHHLIKPIDHVTLVGLLNSPRRSVDGHGALRPHP